MTTALEIDYEWLIGRINEDILLGKHELTNILSERYVIPIDALERVIFVTEVSEVVKSIDPATKDKIDTYYNNMKKVMVDLDLDLDISKTHIQHTKV